MVLALLTSWIFLKFYDEPIRRSLRPRPVIRAPEAPAPIGITEREGQAG